MVTFRNNSNNNRRPPFRSNNNRRPPFRSHNEGSKFSSSDNFRRSAPGRNNHNAIKLIEKYNDLAREALANEDKILSESYFQHADHFTRVQNEQESIRMARTSSSPTAIVKPAEEKDEKLIKTDNEIESVKPAETIDEKLVKSRSEKLKKIISETENKKVAKTSEKKSAVS